MNASAAPAFVAGGACVALLGGWVVKKTKRTSGFVHFLSPTALASAAGWLLVMVGVVLALIIGPGIWFAYR